MLCGLRRLRIRSIVRYRAVPAGPRGAAARSRRVAEGSRVSDTVTYIYIYRTSPPDDHWTNRLASYDDEPAGPTSSASRPAAPPGVATAAPRRARPGPGAAPRTGPAAAGRPRPARRRDRAPAPRAAARSGESGLPTATASRARQASDALRLVSHSVRLSRPALTDGFVGADHFIIIRRLGPLAPCPAVTRVRPRAPRPRDSTRRPRTRRRAARDRPRPRARHDGAPGVQAT